MGNVAYDPAFVLRVVALASVRGAPAAAKQFGVPVRSVRAWQAERPSDEDQLDLNIALAQQELTIDLAEGKNRHRLPVTYGILRDKRARYGKAAKPATEAKTAAEDLADRLIAAMAEEFPGTSPDLPIILLLAAERLDGEWPADPIGYLSDLLETHGSMEAARAWQHSEDVRRTDAQIARNAVGALLWRARSELMRTEA